MGMGVSDEDIAQWTSEMLEPQPQTMCEMLEPQLRSGDEQVRLWRLGVGADQIARIRDEVCN